MHLGLVKGLGGLSLTRNSMEWEFNINILFKQLHTLFLKQDEIQSP